MAAFGIDIHDKPKSIGGCQSIRTPEGFVIPLAVRQGLAYMDMHPPSDIELDTLEHITFTSDMPWDPSSLDSEPADDSFASVPNQTLDPDLVPPSLTGIDDFDPDSDSDSDHDNHVAQPNFSSDELNLYCCLLDCNNSDITLSSMMSILPKNPNYDALRPYFGWAQIQRIKHTFDPPLSLCSNN